MSIPIIDFAHFDTDPNKIAKEVMDACQSIGFFYAIHHGIPNETIDRAFDLSKEFFDQPLEEKTKYSIGYENHGYTGLFRETLDPQTQKKGDHKEGFNFRSFENGKPFAPLPKVFSANEEFIKDFYTTCHSTALMILKAFAIALEIPKEKGGSEFFGNCHKSNDSKQVLRFLKYPAGGESEYKDPVRAGAHSDYGSITLLFQKDIAGLEVQASRDHWISAPLIPNAIIVNVGDAMEFWTGGLFKSTKHRVVFLPEHNHLDRYSIPFFVHPNSNVPLSPVPSKYVNQKVKSENGHIYTADEFLRSRLDATY
ncbi:hypothetical protein BDB01DRAFT_769934 [Pilobolus umbonatus]|nr:hypothetical protein BDB01DRAFT_769934 [Pilobolus umbonatus]